MPNRSAVQAFLRSIGCESAASDQAQLCLVEKVVEALGEVTPGMIEAAISEYVGDVDAELTWKAMFSARFRGE